MKTAKKKLLFLCLMVMLFSTACSNSGNDSNASSTASPETSTEATSESIETTESTLPSTEEPTTEEAITPENGPPIAELAAKYGFSLGTCLTSVHANDEAYRSMILENFNSLSSTNDMKAYSLLDQRASQKSENGMPVMNYSNADKVVAWAQENGLKVRGHVLVWDADMCDWFFREDYSSSGAYADSETLKARLEYYINDVITHFETKFPGVVYCWDTVNEAVGDSANDYNADDPCHIRVKRNGKDNLFYKYVSKDYIQLSFLYAKNTVEALDADIKLFYNDYSTFAPEKRDAICNLITSINTYEKDADGNYRKLCDGVGMQGYIGGYGQQNGCLKQGDLSLFKVALQQYASLDIQIHITELAIRNYEDTDYINILHATYYTNLFKAILSVNKQTDGAITNVTIWGIIDRPDLPSSDYSYKMNGPYCGLFDENYEPKRAFNEVYKLLAQ